MSNVFGPKKPLFGPYTYRAKQNSNGDTLIAVYHGAKRIAHMDAYWAYSVRTFEDREADVQRYGKGLSCYTDLRTLGAEGKYPNILSVSHAFIDDPAYMNKGVGRAMYEAMMAEGYAVRETRIGGSPGPLFFVPDVCKGVGSTSADALRVWASLGRDYPSAGVVIRVDAPPVVGSRARANPRRRNPDPSWTVKDTDAFLRAAEKMRPAAQRWAYRAAQENKEALLDAYEALTDAERAVLAKAVRETWEDAGYVGRRPLYRTPGRYEEAGHRGAGGLSLSHKPTSGRAYYTPDENVRVFEVSPDEVVLDSTVPPYNRLWLDRFDVWDPPRYDTRGRPMNRRSQMTDAEARALVRSPLWSDQYGAEDEVILKRDAHPPERKYTTNPRRRNPDAEVWYHGRKARSRKFDLKFVGGREATNQEGPGFYFTTSREDASGYAYPSGVVLRATLNVPKWVSRTKRPARSEIERLMRAAPTYEDALTDWDESPYRAHTKALAAIMQEPNQHAAFLTTWAEFYRRSGHSADYLRELAKMGYGGVKAGRGENQHAVVFSPSFVENVEVLEDRGTGPIENPRRTRSATGRTARRSRG